MKLIWLTDIHLNFPDKEGRQNFYQKIIKANGDAILITGDIAEASSIAMLLQEMATYIKKPIYFVLGNHDFYGGEINIVKNEMTLLSQKEPLLNWLPTSGYKILDNDTMLIGQDGWADGRLGDFQNSRVSLNDSRMIVDLFQQKLLGKEKLLKKMQQLADDDARKLNYQLKQIINKNPKQIIVLTHVPPFKETALHEGKICDDSYLPYFSSKTTGDVLMQIAKENPKIKFLVLCGHTHSRSIYSPLENLIIKTGKAEYFHPEIQEVIDTMQNIWVKNDKK